MPGGTPTTRPIAETSIPALRDVWTTDYPIDRTQEGFSWDEDAVSRWRAVALFGGLAAFEGVVWSTEGGMMVLVLGVFLLLATGVMSAAGEEEYVWAAVGALGLAAALGFPAMASGLVDNVPPALMFSRWGLPMNSASMVLFVLVAGGLAAVAVGLTRSLLISRRLAED